MTNLKIILMGICLFLGSWARAQCGSDVEVQIKALQGYQQTLNNIISPSVTSFPQYTPFYNLVTANDWENTSAIGWDYKVGPDGKPTDEMIAPRNFPNLLPSGAFAPF